MKKVNVFVALVVSAGIILSGCGASNATKGGIIGGTSGAALGAGIGAIAAKSGNKGTGAAIGAAVGAAVGTTAGILIGKKMDKQKAELEKINGAQVETVTDTNGLQAIKVTFEGGILFETGKSVLSTASKTALTNFAASLKETPETNVDILGYTDNTGSLATNQKLSNDRAKAVSTFLTSNGITTDRFTKVEGLADANPVADNATTAGRQQNRRVEIFISANEKMIKDAETEANKAK